MRRIFGGAFRPLLRSVPGVFLLMTFGAGCSPDPGADAVDGARFEELTPAAGAQLIGQRRGGDDFVILDVRTPAEFRDERIEGAVNIDFNARAFRDRIAELDKSATYFLYCRTGNRSGQSLRTFRELGFEDIRHLTRGISAWKSEGRPTTRG